MTIKRTNRAMLVRAYHMYKENLDRYAYFKIHDHRIAEELVQNTFLKTLLYIKKGGNIYTIKAFLYNVLHYLVIDEYRKKKTVSLDAMTEKGFGIRDTEAESVEDTVDGKNMLLALQYLPKKYKEVLTMRYTDSLSIAEIADITHRSKNTISVQIYRGLEKLRVLQHITV